MDEQSATVRTIPHYVVLRSLQAIKAMNPYLGFSSAGGPVILRDVRGHTREKFSVLGTYARTITWRLRRRTNKIMEHAAWSRNIFVLCYVIHVP